MNPRIFLNHVAWVMHHQRVVLHLDERMFSSDVALDETLSFECWPLIVVVDTLSQRRRVREPSPEFES